jgi:hypothetical protein
MPQNDDHNKESPPHKYSPEVSFSSFTPVETSKPQHQDHQTYETHESPGRALQSPIEGMYVYMYMYIYMYIYVYMYMYKYMYIYVYM